MGMDSKKLSARARQPGHDRTFRTSENNFVEALKNILDSTEWDIEDHPTDLRKIFGGRFGIVPEASITYKPNGRKMYFEVKKQGPRGNAEERAFKHHTVQFYKELKKVSGLDYHPYVTILCESLATDDRYTLKYPYFFEKNHYFCWVDYDLDALADFLGLIAVMWLIDSTPTGGQVVPK